MTVFNEKVKPENDLGTWFKFQSSHKDKAIADQMDAIQKAAEGRVLAVDEKKQLTALSEKLFVFDPPEENAAEFRIRSLIPFFTKLIKSRKKEYEWVENERTGEKARKGFYPDQTPEEVEKEQTDAWDYMITSIKNAYWGEGKPIECNRENKIKLMADKVFDRFAGKCLRELADTESKEAAEAEKNLPNG